MAVSHVRYRLLHRKPETDGALGACRQLDVALVAYRPVGGDAIIAATPLDALARRRDPRWDAWAGRSRSRR